MAVCSHLKADSERCGARPMRGERWCYVHHPAFADKRRAASRKGGKRGGRGRPLTELAEVKGRLRELAEAVVAGGADRGDAAVAGQLLGTYIRALSVELKVREQDEILQRLQALEAADSQGGSRA